MRPDFRFVAAAASALAFVTLLSPASARPEHDGVHCLWSRQISDTHIPDNRTIIFEMRDGTRWRTQLTGYCPNLKTFGFSYRVPQDQICDRMIIHVNRTHTPCALGRLEKLPREPAH